MLHMSASLVSREHQKFLKQEIWAVSSNVAVLFTSPIYHSRAYNRTRNQVGWTLCTGSFHSKSGKGLKKTCTKFTIVWHYFVFLTLKYIQGTWHENHNEASHLGSLIPGVCPVSAISGRTQQKWCDGQRNCNCNIQVSKPFTNFIT